MFHVKHFTQWEKESVSRETFYLLGEKSVSRESLIFVGVLVYGSICIILYSFYLSSR